MQAIRDMDGYLLVFLILILSSFVRFVLLKWLVLTPLDRVTVARPLSGSASFSIFCP